MKTSHKCYFLPVYPIQKHTLCGHLINISFFTTSTHTNIRFSPPPFNLSIELNHYFRWLKKFLSCYHVFLFLIGGCYHFFYLTTSKKRLLHISCHSCALNIKKGKISLLFTIKLFGQLKFDHKQGTKPYQKNISVFMQNQDWLNKVPSMAFTYMYIYVFQLIFSKIFI